MDIDLIRNGYFGRHISDKMATFLSQPDFIQEDCKIVTKQGQYNIKNEADLYICMKALKQKWKKSSFSENQIFNANSIQAFIKNEFSSIKKMSLQNDILLINVHRPLFFSLLKSSENFFAMKTYKYKIRIDVPSIDVNSSVTGYRSLLIGQHLKRLFEMSGSSVSLKQQSTLLNDSSTSKNQDCKDSSTDFAFCVNSKVYKYQQGVLILCAPVCCITQNNKVQTTYGDYLKHIEEELENASDHKQEIFQEESRKSDFSDIAVACCTLQLLSVNHLTPVKVNLADGSTNSRVSAYILYNHARLCTIFRNFEKLVEDGIIPSLPDAESVDFAVLKQPEEWNLFWHFVYKYSELLEEINGEFFSFSEVKSKSIRSSTHSIAKFIHSLAHCFGIYYNRIHILPPLKCSQGCNYPLHLLPTLWARIHLLKMVHLVYKSCLDSLGIIGPTVM